jgi:hypothetical protein
MDGGAFDSYRICELMARKDLGLGTAVFATFLGSDPIVVGATEEQKHGMARGDRPRRCRLRLRRHRA